jgi:outer membrane biogenesis lipoprotein LolB
MNVWKHAGAQSAAICCAIVLSGCAHVDPILARLFEKSAQITPQVLKSAQPAPFRLTGRVSIAWEAQRWIGAIDWAYAPAHETLALSLAGQDFAQFERYEGRARATLVNGQSFEEDSWSALTRRAIGIGLPFELAPYWVRGATAPDDQVLDRTENSFVQRDWTVSTQERDERGHPKRMRWQRDNVSLTLVIDSWNAL